jgi:Fic-DOC domain mobile mystery protein B
VEPDVTYASAEGGNEDHPDGADSAIEFIRTIGPEPEGASPLDPENLEGLIPDFVATRGDLNAVESENITKSLSWARAQATQGGAGGVLEYALLFELHSRMFGDVWRWAGTQRKLETNIGVDPAQIPERAKQAIDDARYWHEHETYPVDELAARLHHRLVAVHPFPNGNGRCTRLIADLYLLSVGEPAFTWGAGGNLDEDGAARQLYLDALRAADGDDFGPLLAFARS